MLRGLYYAAVAALAGLGAALTFPLAVVGVYEPFVTLYLTAAVYLDGAGQAWGWE